MRCRSPEHGAALVVALLIFAVVASLLVAAESRFFLHLQRSSNALQAEQFMIYLLGAEELAKVALDTDLALDRQLGRERDDLTEIWAQPPVPYPLDEGGFLMGSLTDLQGLFNLNLLLAAAPPPAGADSPEVEAPEAPIAPAPTAADGSRVFAAAEQQFLRLLLAVAEQAGILLDLPAAVAVLDAVVDWIDADESPRPDGAEDGVYALREPAYRTANQPMTHVSELRAVAGVSPELYQALWPWITVWPRQAVAINIHTAPLMVLRSFGANNDLAPLPMAEALRLEQQRQERGFVDVDDLLSDPAFADRDLSAQRQLLGESSSFFALRAEIEIADRQSRLYSVLHRTGAEVRTLVRYQESL